MAETSSLKPQASGLVVTVVTPEETVVNAPATSVTLPLFNGEEGILKGHAPMIGRLGAGEMRLTADGQTTSYFVDGGFVQVAGDDVNVMTNRALPADQIDLAAAEEALKAALDQPAAAGDEAIAARQRVVDQARARVRLAKK